MIKQDYLMQMILKFFNALVKAREKHEKDPLEAAESLEDAITAATDIDGVALLALAPESIASVVQVAGIDPVVVRYIAGSMMLEGVYLREAGDASTAALREAQAQALADAFDFDLPADPADFEGMKADIEKEFDVTFEEADRLVNGPSEADALDLDQFPWLNA